MRVFMRERIRIRERERESEGALVRVICETEGIFQTMAFTPSPTICNMKLSIQSRAARTICPSPSIQTHHHNL